MRVTAAGTRSVRPGTGAAVRRRARLDRTFRLRSSELHAERLASRHGEVRMSERLGWSFDFKHDHVRHLER
jgi:hypothetical protein